MGNVLRILKRDFKRLLKAPAAMIVVVALLVLPSLYTWYNVAAFWNPYDATGNLRVCVVNQDAGTTSDMTGDLDVGSKLVEELQANDRLCWIVDKDYDSAMEDLKVGNVYAVYVIPEDFSANLVSPLTGDIKSPRIEYYANEKLGPVSPKVTDTAASTLEQQINSTFVATVTEVAANAIDEAMEKAKVDISAAGAKASARADESKAAVAQVRATLSDVEGKIGESRPKVSAANDALAGASVLTSDTRTALQDVADGANALQSSLEGISSESIPELSNLLVELSQLTAKANSLADAIASATGKAQTDVDLVVAKVQPVVDAMRDAASDLDAISKKLRNPELKERFSQAAQDMTSRADKLQAVLDDAVELAEQAGKASQAAANAVKAINTAAEEASGRLVQYTSGLHDSISSSVNSGVIQINDACVRLSTAMDNVDVSVGQLRSVLDQLDGILADSEAAMAQTNALIGDVQTDVDEVISDARMLAQSSVIANLLENGTLNAQNISEFMGSPTHLSTTRFYHPNAYGSAMAPLFMNLSFWIGAFMLVIIFLLEVDSAGIEGLKPWQRYLGRFLMFCIFAVIQAIICCAGTLALGVQAANVPALFVASAVASLAFLSIIYMLSSTFRHVGKGICIILVFAQIPGGSGLYPVEMTSSFYQAIYPFLPFTYGIDAMRESIGGFYGSHFAHDMMALGAFFVVNVALGLILGSLMTNVVHMTARHVYEGDLYNGEDAKTPERPYRMTQVLRALSEKGSYREELEVRYARFSRHYPLFIRGSIVLGVGVPVAICFLLALDAAEKVTLLTLFLLWLVILIAFLVVVESLRYSFERQLDLETMSEAKLLRLYSKRNHMVRADDRAAAQDESSEDGDGAHGNGDSQNGSEKPQAESQANRRSAGGMRNVWLIARRDFSGLFKNVMSVAITVGLVALPSLFAWYNILACWNVFDNTDQLSIAVASEDEGYKSDLLPLKVNVGEKVVSALHENDQINWVFVSADDAVEGVNAGTYYAALVIPKSFSKDMLTFYEGDSNSATIDYYVNEKKNAIAPNITGIGADTVSQEVNSVFADTLSEVAVDAAQSLSQAAEKGDAGGRVASLAEHMRAVSGRLDQSADVLDLYASLGRSSQGLLQSSTDITASARESLQGAVDDIDAGKERLRGLVDDLSTSTTRIEEALKGADASIASLSQRADELIADASDVISVVSSKLRAKASELDAKVDELNAILKTLEELRKVLKSLTGDQMTADIEDGKANLKIDLGDGSVYQSDEALAEDIDALSSTITALEDAKAALKAALADEIAENGSELQGKIDEIDATLGELYESRATLQELRDSRTDVEVDIEAKLSDEAAVMSEGTVILDKDIAVLKKAIEILRKASAACTDAANALDEGSADVERAAASLRELCDKVKADAAAVKQSLEGDVEPKIAKLQSDIATLNGDLERGAEKLRSLDPDLASSLSNVAAALGTASSKTDEASAKLRSAADRIRELADAVDTALTSGDIEKLNALLQGDPGDLAAALTSPVHVERTALFPSDGFGSSMTPLYCTLALFIGSLLIMVAMKPGVSRRGRRELVDPKPRHLYFGRFMAVGAVSLMQTTLLGLGTMLFLKVQVVHPLLFMLGFWFSGLVLAFIIYTLVVAFGNLGKAIAVLLLIVQVTACGGSYPLPMLPDFVQAVSPWVPASHIVHILQAAMMGVYHNDFWVAMGCLALFIIPFLLLGLVLRKPMERFMKFYVSKVEECGIMG